MLSEGAGEPNLNVYDTSGPYTDPAVTIDVNAGWRATASPGSRSAAGVEDMRPHGQAGR